MYIINKVGEAMFKKIIILILCLCIVILCSACNFNKIDNTSVFESYIEYIDTESESVQSVASEPHSSSVASKTQNNSSKKSSTVTTVNENKVTVKEQYNTDEELKQPSVQKIDEIKHSYGGHNTVNADEYFQLQSLDGNKRNLYLLIGESVKKSQNIINIGKLNLSQQEVIEVYSRFLADNPQYFYISKSYLIIYNSFGNKIRAIVILYTDGEATDDFDNNMNMTSVADRNIINQKITEVNNSIDTIISTIPDDISDALKEKLLYDYVVNLVEYDYSVIDSNEDITNTNTHAFDIYGALIKGLSVCEGYTKLFQLLCYNVGINSTQVFGEADGALHVWNAIKIDDEWYHSDLTWADDEDSIDYKYFNITTEQVSKTHKITIEYLDIPQCDSIANSFKNLFAIYIENTNAAPADYKTAIENINLLGGKEIYLYVNNYQKDFKGNINLNKYIFYIRKYFSKGTEIENYLSSLGLELATTMYANKEYIVIEFK